MRFGARCWLPRCNAPDYFGDRLIATGQHHRYGVRESINDCAAYGVVEHECLGLTGKVRDLMSESFHHQSIQYERGMPSTCSPMKASTRLVEIGAIC